MGVFEKSQENSGKKKTSDFVSSNLQNSLFLKAFCWYEIVLKLMTKIAKFP